MKKRNMPWWLELKNEFMIKFNSLINDLKF